MLAHKGGLINNVQLITGVGSAERGGRVRADVNEELKFS